MKKLLSLIFLTTLLTACSFKMPFGGSGETKPTVPHDGDTVSVHYVGTLDDGSEFDSSRQEGKTPLQFVIGKGNMIKWFEAGVLGMKLGETKKIRIEAKDAYGEEYIEKTVPLSEYKEVITQTIPTNALTGKLEQKISRVQVENLLGSSAVGTEKKIGEATLKVLSVSGEDALVSINDPKAPFYGKTLTVGMETVVQDNTITIKKINKDTMEIDIKPKQEIINKTATEITVKTKNPHPLAGKALNFEIELLDIKTPTSASLDAGADPIAE